MVKARNNFKKSPKERLTQAYCQTRLESLEMLWSDFSRTHKSLVKTYGSKLREQDYYKKDFYEQTEELFIEYKTEIKQKLNSVPSNLDQTYNVNKSERLNTESFKLPKIVIPNFSGKYTEWITFRDLFLSLIHNNSRLDKVQKMHYLKSSLIGEAEQLLRQIPISEANYDRCWEQLKSRYDNKRYLSHFILKRLLSQRNLTVESSSSLKELIDTTNDCLSGLQNLGIDVSSWDIIIIHIICLKLDPESRKQWEFNITSSTQSEDLPTLDQFKEFLTNRYRALEFLDTKVVSNKYQSSTNKNSNVVQFKSLHVTKYQCVFCSDNHKLSSCKKFINRTVDQRRDFVKINNLCYNCLGANHGVKTCTSSKCNLCHRRHHSLLHPKGVDIGKSSVVQVESEVAQGSFQGSGLNKETGKAENSSAFVACNFSAGKKKQVLLATALVNAVSKNGQNHVLRVLLDQGSQGNFVTEATVNDLKLRRTPIRGHITGVGGDREIMSKAVVTLNIKSRFDSNSVFTVQAYVLKSITSFLPGRKVDKLEFPEFEGIELADPEYNRPNRIDVLLGAELYSQIIQEGIRKEPSGSIVAQSTSLGWILSGALQSSNIYTGVVALHCQLQEGDEILKRFWEIENGISLTKEESYTEEEKKCEKYFIETTSRDETGRYVVRLPFKTDNPMCIKGESRSIAEKRLKGLMKRFEKDKQLQANYKAVMDEYLQMNHMIEVEKTDSKRESALYLAHHPVIREDKKTTKLRIVFNASQAGTNGVALNDELLVGPSIQPDLRHLVIQWRLSRICLTADIIKMYRQIKVHEEDTDFQRLLWIDAESQEVKDYKLLRVTFGTASAPFLAVRTLQQIAIDEGHKYSLAAEKVRSSFYMDDLMCGCETVTEGIEIYKQMKGLSKEGGF
ncbi:uncharacterized protein LOC123655075 [Melitaea cinxia]|uniref:uncharacterized protein LOC123655075 n=1 Tax=Melitaea cinxia TaxID=113334 RepID=UPI001E271017|nr:uncharacterized protein LOC123655075 [Melitaea cinxia]